MRRKEKGGKLLLLLPMLTYLLCSVVVTLLDSFIVFLLHRLLNWDIVSSNTVGVLTGFILHYILVSKSVFETEFGVTGFLIYLGSFMGGLFMANVLIYAGESIIFYSVQENIRFLLSKGISIIIPFFGLFYIRRALFDFLKKRNK